MFFWKPVTSGIIQIRENFTKMALEEANCSKIENVLFLVPRVDL
jgi:hypothetical protein